MIGKTLGHYRIVEKIGEGGMGVVYRAHDERLNRDVALKVLPADTLADESARKRFRKEALALSQLNHPSIETVHDFDTQDGVDFLVMEHIPGITLSDKLAAGPLPEKEIARLGAQLAEGLAAAHAEGVVHRDLKPGNLRVTPDGRLKILDFGLAKLLRPVSASATTESLTETQAVPGTLPYMAPEQLQGETVDERTDLYAAGTVLYEMATGQRPFQARLLSLLTDEILHELAPPPARLNPRLSPRLEEVILKCLEKEPGNRYQSAKELLVDLRRLAAPSTPLTVPHAPRYGRRLLVVVGSTAVVLLAAVLVGLNVGGLRERLLGATGPPRIQSLAVLPLENLSRDPEQEYFVDGMHEELIANLAKIRALKVISRTSVMQYRGARKPLPEIARELGVEAVIEGSVRREGNQVRISVQLIEAATDRHLWAESYQRDLQNVLALQSEVARAIAQEIQVTLTPQEQVRLASARPVNPEAYEAYLKGRFFFDQRTAEATRKAIQYFETAIKKEPSYAPGYAGLADCYVLYSSARLGPPNAGYPKAKAKAAALKAVELDDSLAEAHYVLARVLENYEWDWKGAEREYQGALELNSSLALAHQYYGAFLSKMGRHEEAIAEGKRALELDPLSVPISNSLGTRLLVARHYDQAIYQYRKTLEMDPNFFLARRNLGLSYISKGMLQEGILQLEKAVSLSADPITLAQLAHAYAVAGKRTQAEKLLAQLQAESKKSYVFPSTIALLYVGLGEKDRALAWLEKAYAERDPELGGLKVSPEFDPLRSDPRFQDLLRRMNFPP